MRLVFDKGDQIEFFKQVKERSGLSRDSLGIMVGIVGRSLSDWATGKLLPKEEGVRFLSQRFGIPIPKIIETREEWWSGRINGRNAAMVGLAKCGTPGTLESRKKGGITSQQKRKENPEFYRNLGCIVPNSFNLPKRSSRLAEFMGVVLGDGGLTRSQCQIYLNYEDDSEYAVYVAALVDHLFDYRPGIFEYPNDGCRRVIITGVEFVKIMVGFGLKIGNKVTNQVGIPVWIKNNHLFYRSCIRGLFDTDGGTFTHVHWVKKYKYCHFGLTFTSASRPLLDGFHCYLNSIGIKSSMTRVNIFIYGLDSVKKFFDVVRPSNEKHIRRFKKHLSSSTRLN